MNPEVYIDPQYLSPQKGKSTFKNPFKKVLNKRFAVFLIIVVLILIGGRIVLANGYNLPKIGEKKGYVISQSLSETLGKQSLLEKEASKGEIDINSLIKVATTSVVPQEEVVRINNDYYFSTGVNGQVDADIPKGNYKVKIVPVNGVNFTRVPKEFVLALDTGEILIGVVRGTGQVIEKKGAVEKTTINGIGKAVITLFFDENGDGVKQKQEPYLKWAGVTVVLEREFQ